MLFIPEFHKHCFLLIKKLQSSYFFSASSRNIPAMPLAIEICRKAPHLPNQRPRWKSDLFSKITCIYSEKSFLSSFKSRFEIQLYRPSLRRDTTHSSSDCKADSPLKRNGASRKAEGTDLASHETLRPARRNLYISLIGIKQYFLHSVYQSHQRIQLYCGKTFPDPR